MISVSATTARSCTVRPLPANHRCLTSHVASVSSKVMSAYHIPVAGPGKHARPISGLRIEIFRATIASLLVALCGAGQVIPHGRRVLFLGGRPVPGGDHGAAL